MSWILLFCAELLEIAWAYFMKHSAGFTLFGPSLLTITMMFARFTLLAVSMKTLLVGTAYTIWSGSGRWAHFSSGSRS